MRTVRIAAVFMTGLLLLTPAACGGGGGAHGDGVAKVLTDPARYDKT